MVFSTKNSEEIRHGGKIIMPPSALEKLARLNITYPMLFKLSNTKRETETHCGVLEFIAEEGRIYIPHWVSILRTYTQCLCSQTVIKITEMLPPLCTHMYATPSIQDTLLL